MVLSEVMSGVLMANLEHVVWHIAYSCCLCASHSENTTCISKSVLRDVPDDNNNNNNDNKHNKTMNNNK